MPVFCPPGHQSTILQQQYRGQPSCNSNVEGKQGARVLSARSPVNHPTIAIQCEKGARILCTRSPVNHPTIAIQCEKVVLLKCGSDSNCIIFVNPCRLTLHAMSSTKSIESCFTTRYELKVWLHSASFFMDKDLVGFTFEHFEPVLQNPIWGKWAKL
ncbi:hypothetical protein J6590_024045 [Homalodisca vitripennis]|nr:hypothetical protein J6590_024045 [Homalodisca vitripennis]